ncbi:MAG: effector binding domain-containing protein [Clostridia bacterium]|nr:effector binding domain-containing protein [Clostridia bacterium]
MKYEIVELKEKIVEGVEIKTTNQDGKSMQDIGELWQKFFAEGVYEKIENKVNTKTIGLYTDYEGDYTNPYNFVVCTEVSKKSDNLENRVVKTIPAGKYAKFTIIGDVQKAVGEAWTEIWNMDLNRKYDCDFEEYQNNSEDMNNQEIHIYISLQN